MKKVHVLRAQRRRMQRRVRPQADLKALDLCGYGQVPPVSTRAPGNEQTGYETVPQPFHKAVEMKADIMILRHSLGTRQDRPGGLDPLEDEIVQHQQVKHVKHCCNGIGIQEGGEEG